ncbi:MAG: endo-1,4-beta-xylanase [Planctomycetota bacterium]|jgi:endo-1,4-beta-xylanase|nr:endo-1,4-beta-xylanase [Planctomycetota bacterium]
MTITHSSSLRLGLAAALTLCFSLSGVAAEPLVDPLAQQLAALPSPVDVIAGASSEHTSQVAVTAVTVAGQAAERVATQSKPKKSWMAQYSRRTQAAIPADARVVVTFLARAAESPAENGTVKARVNFGLAAKPYTKFISQGVSVADQWQRFAMRGIVPQACEADGAKVEFFVGDQVQAMDVADLRVLVFPSSVEVGALPVTMRDFAYPGREADAPWRAAALARIEANRMAPLSVTVRDAAGAPVPGAQVHVALQQHAFTWGCSFKASYIMAGKVDYKLPSGLTADQARAKVRTLLTESRMFNTVVLGNDLKWEAWNGKWGSYGPAQRAQTDACIDWLAQQGLRQKGHVMVWGTRSLPKAVPLDDGGVVARSVIPQRIAEIGGRYAGKLQIWDVINENYMFRAITDLTGDAQVPTWFKQAKEVTGARLFWNEVRLFNNTERSPLVRDYTEEWIKRLQAAGAPIDGVGYQAHLSHGSAPTPEELLERMDRFGALGVEIMATEFDLSVSSLDDPEEQAWQADYVRDFLIANYSHPAVTGVVSWTPVVAKWIPKSALHDEAFNLRPHGDAWRKLVTETWWTDETVAADAQGVASVRGYHGDYLVTVSHAGKSAQATLSLAADGAQLEVTLP